MLVLKEVSIKNYPACKDLNTNSSLFVFTLFLDKEYLLHFTSTTPLHMRYMLLNSDDTEVIKLTVWYSRPNRLDVYVDGNYIMATNARINHLGFYVLEMPIGRSFAHPSMNFLK